MKVIIGDVEIFLTAMRSVLEVVSLMYLRIDRSWYLIQSAWNWAVISHGKRISSLGGKGSLLWSVAPPETAETGESHTVLGKAVCDT